MNKYFLISTLILFSCLKAQEVASLTLEMLQECAAKALVRREVGNAYGLIKKRFCSEPNNLKIQSFGTRKVLVGEDINGQKYFFNEDNHFNGVQVLITRYYVSRFLPGKQVRTHTMGFVNGKKTEIFDIRYESNREAVKDVVAIATLVGFVCWGCTKKLF